MAWFKLDDKAHSHPKTIMAGNAAYGLWCRLGSYCSEHLTDGFVPTEVANAYGSKAEVAALLRVGYLEATDGGYLIHDYLDYNPDKVKVIEERRVTAERVANFRRNKRSGNAVGNTSGNAVTPPDTNAVGTASPDPDPDPDPSVLTSQNKTDRQNTDGEVGRSVEFDQTVLILTHHAEDNCPSPIVRRDRWRDGTDRIIRTERTADIQAALDSGLSPQEAACRVAGDPSGVRASMRKRGMTVEAPAGWGAAS